MVKIIKNWSDLDSLESENYFIEVDHYYGCGWIRAKDETLRDEYLSTHTFYGETYKGYEKILRNCGFDVKLVSWDKENVNNE